MIAYISINNNLLIHYNLFTRQSYHWQGGGEWGQGTKDMPLPDSLHSPIPPSLLRPGGEQIGGRSDDTPKPVMTLIPSDGFGDPCNKKMERIQKKR